MKLLLSRLIKNKVNDDTENESASDGGYLNCAEGYRKAADTRDEDNGNNEEVVVFAEVHLLDHLQTRNRNEAVKRNANTAHYAGRDRIDKSDEG